MGHEIIGARLEELENGFVRHGLAPRGGLRHRGRARFGILNVFQDDAAMGAGAFKGCEINALLLGNALREGRSKYSPSPPALRPGPPRRGGDASMEGSLPPRLGEASLLAQGGGFSLIAKLLALTQNDGDGRIHQNIISAFGHQNFAKGAFIDGFHFHCGLVGLDLGQHIAGLHLSPLS